MNKSVQECFAEIIKKYKELSKDSVLSSNDVVTILVDGVGQIVKLLGQFNDLDNVSKKKLALEMVDSFYQDVIRPLDIPDVPGILENRIVDPIIGKVVHNIADGLIEGVFKLLKQSRIVN